jgi:hypothetical protein
MNQSLSFALYRTYAVPSIGGLLKRTGEFTERTHQEFAATLDRYEAENFGYRRPPSWERTLATGALRLRGQFVRRLPPRREPRYARQLPTSAATPAATKSPSWAPSRLRPPPRPYAGSPFPLVAGGVFHSRR